MRVKSTKEKGRGGGPGFENAYLELCAWDLFLEKPDLRRDTHIHSHKWRSSKWHAIIQGGFGGGAAKKSLVPGTNSPICKIQLVKAKKETKSV